MKYTSEMLMKNMGIQVGDTVKLNGKTHTFTTKKDGTLVCKNVLKQLIDQEFDIIPKPKKFGELECEDIACENCPLRSTCGWHVGYQGKNLYKILDYELKIVHEDLEIYNILKARLDNVLEE